MCTLVILRRPGHDWPLILGANRDEMRDRPWRPPARHWPDRPEVVAGLDELAQGSWMGINDHGVAAAVLNRTGSLGPSLGKRSRGELVLEALDHADAAGAAEALAALDPAAYRPFNLFIGDDRDAYWLAHRGAARIAVAPVVPGLSMLTARELDDADSPRIRHYRARFAAAAPPDPERDDWAAWQDLLMDREPAPGHGAESAMAFMLPMGFGTLMSSILALPAAGRERLPEWRVARPAGQPSGWQAVRLG